MGGTSSEREVSLMSGKNVAEALASLGRYEVLPVDVKDDTLDAMPKDVDAAYIALHGGWGENGGVQAALNALKVPYTGPGVAASQIAMDKVKTKMVLEMRNVPTAKWGLANPDTEKSPLRRRDVLHLQHHLRLHLVHRNLRGEDAGTRVGNLERVERGLHAAVFSPSAVKRNVRGIDILRHRIKRVVRDVHWNDLVLPETRKRLGDILPRHQGNLAFTGGSAHQNSNPFHEPNYTIYCDIIHGE